MGRGGSDAVAFCAEEFPRLVGALGLYVGDEAVAEELAQEALLRACRRWDRVSQLESPGGWTWRVARNLANSHLRRRQAERRARARLPTVGRIPDAEGDAADSHAVRRAVARLPERQRRVLVLRYFLDWSVAATATEMEVSQNAVRSLAKRAIAALREDPVTHGQEGRHG
ncbi:MAG: sigma-70 family RNA polymerase sigma factor [Nitriliruptoraceae bacterium]